MSTKFLLEIKATGEVRDADGNLISTDPVTGEMIVTEAQALQILEAQARAQEGNQP